MNVLVTRRSGVVTSLGRVPFLFRRSKVTCSSTPPKPRPSQPTYYPGIEEDSEVTFTAFRRAFSEAVPEPERVAGLQEFAAAIWERRRLIPSQHDPLMHIFDEFDHDNDGVLSSPEVASALKSRGVTINTEQVQWLMDTFEQGKTCPLPNMDHTIARPEWPDFVYSLTVANMHAKEDHSKSILD